MNFSSHRFSSSIAPAASRLRFERRLAGALAARLGGNSADSERASGKLAPRASPSSASIPVQMPEPAAASPDLLRQRTRDLAWRASPAGAASICLARSLQAPAESGGERLRRALERGAEAARGGAAALAAKRPWWRLAPERAADLTAGPSALAMPAAMPGLLPADALLSGLGEPPRLVQSPVDPGALLRRHRSWAGRIRTALGSERLFEAHALPAMLRWAAAVQGLPRAPKGLFAEADGLFSCGLMLAAAALPQIDRRPIGLERPPRERRAYEERLRMAACLAGLFCGLGVLEGLCVEAGAADAAFGGFRAEGRWEPAAELLLDFSLRHAGRTLRLSWRGAGGMPPPALPGRSAVLHALARALPAETAAWLREDPECYAAFEGAATGALMANEAGKLVSDALLRAKVHVFNARAVERAKRDASHPALLGWAEAAVHAAKTLVLEGRWVVNPSGSGERSPSAFLAEDAGAGVPRAPLWWAADGLFVPWPLGALSISAQLRDAWGFDRAPTDPWILAALLVEAGFAAPAEGGALLHEAALPPGLAPWAAVSAPPAAAEDADVEGDEERFEGERESEEPGVFSALLIEEPQSLVDLAASWAQTQGERLRPLELKLRRRRCQPVPGLLEVEAHGRAAPSAVFFWAPAAAGDMPRLAAEVLFRAVEAASRRSDAAALAMKGGLFLSADAFPPGRLLESAELLAAAGALEMQADGRYLVRTRPASPESRFAEPEEGVVLHPLWVRPRLAWPNGEEEDAPWPEPGRVAC